MRNFIIIGAQRSGTTSLYEYICAHPKVERAKHKEIHFFDWQYERGFTWYKCQFPRTHGLAITGEASPSYLFDPAVPERVKRHKPHVRLIAILRNPVDRAYSQYCHNKRRETEPLTFKRALEAEEERLQATETSKPSYKQFMEWSYKARGRYAEQLLRWLALFPPEQLLVLRAEDLFTLPAETMAVVWEYLELEPVYQEEYEAHRAQSYRVYASTREYLADYFRIHNQTLGEMLGRDFGWG
jgi:hypothetical protein